MCIHMMSQNHPSSCVFSLQVWSSTRYFLDCEGKYYISSQGLHLSIAISSSNWVSNPLLFLVLKLNTLLHLMLPTQYLHVCASILEIKGVANHTKEGN